MNNLTISVFGNQIFSEVLNEIKLLSKFDAKSYNDLNLCMKDAVNYNPKSTLQPPLGGPRYPRPVRNLAVSVEMGVFVGMALFHEMSQISP